MHTRIFTFQPSTPRTIFYKLANLCSVFQIQNIFGRDSDPRIRKSELRILPLTCRWLKVVEISRWHLLKYINVSRTLSHFNRNLEVNFSSCMKNAIFPGELGDLI